jgi:queuosine precursor transporter
VKARAFWIVGYVATIFVANWSLSHVGDCSQPGPCTVPVWPGVAAPSGVVFVGLAFTLRDLVQETFGRYWTIVAILTGALLSAALSPQLALASGTAFLFSELADFGVYTPMRERTWLGAVAASNSVGLVVDSVLFLTLAFGSLDFLAGQIIGKLEMTVLAVAVLLLVKGRRAVLARDAHANLA